MRKLLTTDFGTWKINKVRKRPIGSWFGPYDSLNVFLDDPEGKWQNVARVFIETRKLRGPHTVVEQTVTPGKVVVRIIPEEEDLWSF